MRMLIIALLLAMAVVGVYFGVGACVCRFGIESLLFPAMARRGADRGQLVYRIPGRHGDAMLMRQFGTPQVGCIVFFPGQHGDVSTYQTDLFPAFNASGLAVFALSYPGQNGAPGRTRLSEIQELSHKALGQVHTLCPLSSTVLVGRSLGAMLAAYATQASHPAGLVLEAAAPSLSAAIRTRLKSRWYLSPLAVLPLSRLLPHDYSLAEALSDDPGFPVVVFQGTADLQTPIGLLRAPGAMPAGTCLVPVPAGTHSDSYRRVLADYVGVALRMIRPGRAGACPR